MGRLFHAGGHHRRFWHFPDKSGIATANERIRWRQPATRMGSSQVAGLAQR